MANEQKQETVSYWEKHSIPRVTLSAAQALLETQIQDKQTRGVMCLIGDGGIGKTQIVEEVAEKHGYVVSYLNLAQFSLLSGGIPKTPEGSHFDIAVPAQLPRHGGPKTLLFFDEMNQGTDSAIKMFFQLVETRKLYNYTLPEDTLMVAAMNPATKSYSVSRIEMDVSMNRRLSKYFVYPSVEAFLRHAETPRFCRDGKCHPTIVQYIKDNNGAMMDEKARDAGKQFATPATWQTVSERLYMFDRAGISLTSTTAELCIGGIIGTVSAAAFLAHVKAGTALSPADILTKYPEKRLTVKRLLAEGSPVVMDALNNLPSHLFVARQEPSQIAENLTLFLTDISRGQIQAFFTALDQKSREVDDGIGYLTKLSYALSANKTFAALTANLREVEAMITGVRSRDPLA
jgi:hypothetical protein